MDRLKRARKPLRSQITKYHGEIISLLDQDDTDETTVTVKLQGMNDVYSSLEVIDKQITDLLIDDPNSEKDIDEEFKQIMDYKEKYLSAKVRADKYLKDSLNNADNSSGSNASTGSNQNISMSRKYPKLSLRQFDGDLKEWLGFWAQFRTIHEDERMPTSEKFQYLVQSMIKGSKAHLLVNSYPQSDENYSKVIEALKQRFGKEELLIEVYVRELLKLVISNNSSNKRQQSLGRMFDTLESHLRSLESLGMTTEKYASMLFPLVESGLPEELLRAWQRSSFAGQPVAGNKSKLTYLMDFLRQEVESEERITLARSGFDSSSKHQTKQRREDPQSDKLFTAAGLYVGSDKNVRCIFCEGDHNSDRCIKAQTMALDEKKAIVLKKKCCYSCLNTSHIAKYCKIPVKCVVCGKKHYAVLCPELNRNKDETRKVNNGESTSTKQETSQNSVSMGNQTKTSRILLQTVMVKARGTNSCHKVRLMLDSGAQRSYITLNCATDINAEFMDQEQLAQVVFGGDNSGTQFVKRYSLYLESLNGGNRIRIEALAHGKICGDIPKLEKGPWLRELSQKRIWINDMTCESEDIDILIGCDYYGQIITGKTVKLHYGLTAIETIFGWTVIGAVQNESDVGIAMAVTCMSVNSTDISDLWKLELLGIMDPSESQSKEERDMFAFQHFKQTVIYSPEGRYEICLPWILDKEQLPRNRELAEKRLSTTTKSLREKGKLLDYDKVFQDWLVNEYIEQVADEDLDGKAHYLPHRPVFKDKSETTPVRPVFDASAKCGKLFSLNDGLEKGPNLLELIPTILLRFREKSIGVTADIKRAFMMISVQESDRDYLRFLWWNNDFTKIVEYKHNRVVFGLTCSPFLLSAVIEHHLERAPEHLKSCANVLKRCMYVDNCVTSVNSSREFDEFRLNATELLVSANMDLRGWECNIECLQGDSNKSTTICNVLGLQWDRNTDSISCIIPEFEVNQVTRRKVLSAMQKIYDPMGFLAPVTLIPKLILQQTWIDKSGWDDPLPDIIAKNFEIWVSQIGRLSEIKIPRWMVGATCERALWTMHVFCDASQRAYSAVVFLKCPVDDGYSVQLLFAKSRVAPIKHLTIPRLELMAAVIGVRIARMVKTALCYEDINITYWTDSSTVLAWLSRANLWSVFVKNRVNEILSLSDVSEWRHVSGCKNPADLPSRGCTPEKLVNSRWWEGPPWLAENEDSWTTENFEIDEEIVQTEMSKTAINLHVKQQDNWYVKFSSYTKIVRILAWILRFIGNSKGLSRNGNLSVDEIEQAERKLIWIVQKETFKGEMNKINVQTTVDEEDILRVTTKIARRDDTYEFCNPLLLPSKHHIVDCLVREVHLQNSHCGIQILMSKLRERFWILRSRKTVKRIKGQCGICKRFDMPKLQTSMAPLPTDRVKDAAVFEVVGTDLAGPLFLKDGTKVWLVLYTCAVYRAIHLELATSLSTECFIQSLRRFIARRGRPTIIYSDNGTNFRGTDNAFRALDWDRIMTDTATARIRWNFNPPTASWWGGWWERLVRMIKDLLVRVLGRSILNYEELLTMVCDVENTINSRPLTYISDDKEELRTLTPAMFLREVESAEVPDIDNIDRHSLNKRYRLRQRIREDLRARFRKEYMGHLIQRKREMNYRDIQVGDVVLIDSDNLKKTSWPIARVLELYPGRDGHTRVVKLKTSSGELVRPVQRLHLLEAASPETVRESTPRTSEDAKVTDGDQTKDVKEDVKLSRSGRDHQNQKVGGCNNYNPGNPATPMRMRQTDQAVCSTITCPANTV